MCGIFGFFSKDKTLVEYVRNGRLDAVTRTIKSRGPDRTSSAEGEDFLAIHTLLSMTGHYRQQPVRQEPLLLLFNGEIYNDYRRYSADYGDTDYLIGQLIERREQAFIDLDGEFAIMAHFEDSKTLYLASDPFGTKPFFYQLGKDFCVAGSYAATVATLGLTDVPIQQVPANAILEISTETYEIRSIKPIHQFSFDRDSESVFTGWNEAFAQSIVKRTTSSRQKCFVSMSAGHDSGLIVAELLQQGIPFRVYTTTNFEDPEVIEQRLRLLDEAGIEVIKVNPEREEYLAMKAYLIEHCEPYLLINKDSDFRNFPNPDMRYLSGYVVSALIHQKARRDGYLISLTGQGADEIYADYYNEFSSSRMSDMKGDWTLARKPWPNFFGGWNRTLIGGGERIAGLFGVETRYPFLDRELVQQFLFMTPATKGRFYKSPVTNRLVEYAFPHHLRKQGFVGFKE